MADVKKISKNSLFLFLRMAFLMAIGLYTTRAILEALGIVDLGISNVVSSMILLFDFASTSLTNSTQRYLNVGLGHNDPAETRRYFSQSLSVHFLLAIAVVLVLETFGLWVVKTNLIIPPDRMTAAMWCYQFSVLGVFMRIIKICFDSNIIAREKMSAFAYIGMFEGVAKLAICFLVIYNSSFDKLIYYSFLLVMVSFTVSAVSIIYCLSKFPESRYYFYWNKTLFREILNFIGFNSFGALSWAFGIQGVNIVLNMFFGPVVNGAKGIAATVQRAVMQFASNLDVAVKPQLTQAYAQGNNSEMIMLAMKATRYIYLLMLLLCIPVLFQTDDILMLWLGEVPPYTVVFMQVMLVDSLVFVLTQQFCNIAFAIGKIKTQQVYGRLFTLSGLPLSWLALYFFKNPYLPVFIMLAMSLCYCVFCIWDTNRHLHFGVKSVMNVIYFPVFRATALCLIAAWLITFIPICDSLLISFLIRSVVICLVTFCIAWLSGVDKPDRILIQQKIKSKFTR
jgi:O-antigen/teichoic acid export membrane protein